MKHIVMFTFSGIGVDDMFMLMSGISNAEYEDDVETRIGETMRTSGVSITITSLTDLLAFAAGASSVFLSVRNFCIYCGKYILHIHVFDGKINNDIPIADKETGSRVSLDVLFK